MEYFKGLDAYKDGTYNCNDNKGCLYNQNGRCIYNIAPIQQRISRACYEVLRQVEIEAELDYMDGY